MSDPGGTKGDTILFICTGNTCRSPLAEAICKRILAERLGCGVADLPGRGYRVSSAGMAAYPDMPATPEAVQVAREFGAELDSHRSRSASLEDVRRAREIRVMTRSHQEMLRQLLGEGGPPVWLLRADGEDVVDPIGGDMAVYRECAETIGRELERLVGEWQSA